MFTDSALKNFMPHKKNKSESRYANIFQVFKLYSKRKPQGHRAANKNLEDDKQREFLS